MKHPLKYFSGKSKQWQLGTLFVALFAVIGILALLFAHAAGVYTALEPENGTLSGSATTVSDSNASGGKYVKFGAASSTDTRTAGQRGLSWYQQNTGIQAGHTLTLHGTGDWTLTSADSNKTFNDMQVNGSVITTSATNVTFNNLKAYRVVNPNGGGGMVYNHCELDGTNLPNNDVYDNQATDGTYNFCNVHNGFRAIQWGKSVWESDTWIHDLRELSSGTHRCGTASNGMDPGGVVVIQRIWDDPGDWGTELSGSLCMYGDFNPIHDVTVTGSYFGDSGSYFIYGGSCSGKVYPQASNVSITNNSFGPFPVKSPPGAQYGAVLCWYSGNNNVWSGNTKLSDGSTVTP